MWKKPQFSADLITFAEEIFNRKRLFYSSTKYVLYSKV